MNRATRYAAITLLVVQATFFFGVHSALGEARFTKPASDIFVPEGRDFASERFSDPWDMDQNTDLSGDVYTNQMTDISWGNGLFSAKTTGTDANFPPLFPGYDGVVFSGRDGFINRIDSSIYNRISFRIYSDKKAAGQVYWFYNQFWTDFGYMNFSVAKGWRTYTINLPASGKWYGSPLGIRIDPSSLADQFVSVDWIRLYRSSDAPLEIAWSTTEGSQTASSLYLDDDADLSNGYLDTLGSFSATEATYLWDPAAYPPGRYYFAATSSTATIHSKPITIVAAPLIKLIEPNEAGGRDYAATEMGDAWDMDKRSDVWFWKNLKDVVFSDGVMSGTPKNGDGYIHLRVRKPINAKKYHRLSFRFRYDGPFEYGAGTMSRVIWSSDHSNADLYQVINDIVTYPTWQTYTIDLKTAGLDVGAKGWSGLVRDFRFDPLEWRARRRFYLDYIRLRADDTGDRRFIIKWTQTRSGSRPTSVDLYYDRDNKNFDGTLIKANLPLQSGTSKFTWETSRVARGAYYIYAVAKDGVNSTRWYSSGPVRIIHKR